MAWLESDFGISAPSDRCATECTTTPPSAGESDHLRNSSEKYRLDRFSRPASCSWVFRCRKTPSRRPKTLWLIRFPEVNETNKFFVIRRLAQPAGEKALRIKPVISSVQSMRDSASCTPQASDKLSLGGFARSIDMMTVTGTKMIVFSLSALVIVGCMTVAFALLSVLDLERKTRKRPFLPFYRPDDPRSV